MTLEVLRFETLPATGAVAVLELEGTFDGPAPGRPRLLVEGKGPAREVPAVDAAGGEPWSAAFAVPLAAAADPATAFSLVTGRGPLIALPPPTPAGPGGDEDRYVALARSANELRHRAAVAADAADEAVRRAQDAEAERDRLAAELTAAHEATAAAERRAAEAVDRQEREAREQRETAERELEAQRAAAETARREAEALRAEAEQARAEAEEHRTRLVATEDEVRQSRRELRDTRARLEQLRRERSTPHAPAEPPAAPPPPEAPDEPPARAHGHDPDPTERLAAIAPAGRDDEPPARPRRNHRAIGEHDDPGETAPMPPAQVGARLLQPSSGRPPATAVTPARIAAGAALLVLVAALVAVLLGAGPMT